MARRGRPNGRTAHLTGFQAPDRRWDLGNQLVMDRTRSTALAATSAARSMSSWLVKRPRLNRTDSKAASLDKPIANNTSEGSMDPAEQALPADTATGSMFAKTASESAPTKRTFAVLGRRRVTSPFSCTSSSRLIIAATRRSRSAETLPASSRRSSAARRAAAPSPTIPATFSEPDRNPLSCPPPMSSGSNLRWAWRVQINAPTPPGPQILWPLTETRSTPSSPMSNFMRPAICVASQ